MGARLWWNPWLTIGAGGLIWAASCGGSDKPTPTGHPRSTAGMGGGAGSSSAGRGGGGKGGAKGGRAGASVGDAGNAANAAGGAGEGGAGQSGTGGTAAPGGQGGMRTSSGGGAGESGGGQGGAGAGTAPVCHSTRAESPVLPATLDLDPSRVARAAAVIGSCWDDDGVNRNATHLWHSNLAASRFYFRLTTELDCVADANCGCDAIEHCFGFGIAPAATCTPGCDGSNFTGCGADVDLADGYRATFACDSVGLSCDTAAICTDGPAASCDEASFTPACTFDGRPEYCDEHAVWHGQACAGAGLTCQDGACVGTGADCGSTLDVSGDVIEFDGMGCTGDVLEACVGQKSVSVDCTTQGPGFGCQEHGGAFFCGLADECTPAGDASDASGGASCSGTVLRFCNAGRLERIDCTKLGFTGCDVDPSVGHYGCVPRQFE